MSYLAMFHWGWLLGALLLGFVAGWIAVVQRSRGVSKVTARWLAVLVAALVVAALTRIVPGRPGYWLDLGLVMFALYLVGCTIGSGLRDWAVSRHAPTA
jgi:fructose-specific phosphotransferase system IIC component